MRDLVVYSLMSLDGVGEEPSDWMFEADEEVFANLGAVIARQDDILLGRGTYDYWADYWPTADVQPFADFVNATTKHVVTSSTPPVAWANSVRVDEPVADYVRRLQGLPGGDIGVHGSLTLVQSLLAADLVDRLELVVVPTLAAGGRRLFDGGHPPRRLTLERAATSPTGVVFLSYARRVD